MKSNLGLPCEIGTKVPLKIQANGETIEDTFTLCGYFKGDSIAQSQTAAVSRAYADQAAPSPSASVMDTNIDASDYAGRIMADFNFATSFNLGKQVAEPAAHAHTMHYIRGSSQWRFPVS